MKLLNRKPKVLTPEQAEEIYTKDFFDMILPSTIKFFTDYYIVGDSYRSVWAVREYPPSTEEQAILSQLADRNGVTLRIYHRLVESMEQRKIIQNATRKNKLKSSGNDVNETIEAQGNLQDVVTLMANLRKNKEPLLHCSVFIELKAKSKQKLKELQTDIAMELTRSKIEVDRLTLRQKEGFLSVNPIGSNQFGLLYERVLPASSVANLFPFNFSGKTDPNGLYIGRDKYGTNILVDFDRRTEDKTTSNILILGNSGQGKSYLLKLILTNIRESGKKILCLDPEAEYEDLTNALRAGGGRWGAVPGAVLGGVPQCGLSAVASNVYASRVITLGTLMAVYLATSDEAIPLLVSMPAYWDKLILLMVIKVVYAVFVGFMLDFVLRKALPRSLRGGYTGHADEVDCHEEHSDEEGHPQPIWKAALRHTLEIFVFIFVFSLVFGLIVEGVGEDVFASVLGRMGFFQPVVAALVGLVPNCAASVLMTQLYVEGALRFSSLVAGLCTGAGVGLAVLWRVNPSWKQNLFITGLTWACGAAVGVGIQIVVAFIA